MPYFDYITACVNTLDYLEVTFNHNRHEFDRFTVITDQKDVKTQQFCKDNLINCVVTNAFYRPGATFDRGYALNYGFASIVSKKNPAVDWVIHADCDVFVPQGWRNKLPKLDKEFFYGSRRVLLNTYQDYQKFSTGIKKEDDFKIPLGIGYGFFQMFNWQSRVIQQTAPGALWHPASPRGDVCESDWMFRNKWGEHGDHDYTKCIGNLAELPFSVYHIGPHGTNHQGRKSEPFKV